MTTYATFRSRCGECQGVIEEGEPIVCEDDEWLHEECAIEQDDFMPTLDDDLDSDIPI